MGDYKKTQGALRQRIMRLIPSKKRPEALRFPAPYPTFVDCGTCDGDGNLCPVCHGVGQYAVCNRCDSPLDVRYACPKCPKPAA